MTLTEYLHLFPQGARGAEISRLTAAAGISPESLRSYRQGRRNPAPLTALALSKATGNRVKVADLLPDLDIGLIRQLAKLYRETPAAKASKAGKPKQAARALPRRRA